MTIVKLHSTCIVYNGEHEYCTQFHPFFAQLCNENDCTKLSVTPSMAPELAQLCNDYYTVWHTALAMYIEF